MRMNVPREARTRALQCLKENQDGYDDEDNRRETVSLIGSDKVEGRRYGAGTTVRLVPFSAS